MMKRKANTKRMMKLEKIQMMQTQEMPPDEEEELQADRQTRKRRTEEGEDGNRKRKEKSTAQEVGDVNETSHATSWKRKTTTKKKVKQ